MFLEKTIGAIKAPFKAIDEVLNPTFTAVPGGIVYVDGSSEQATINDLLKLTVEPARKMVENMVNKGKGLSEIREALYDKFGYDLMEKGEPGPLGEY